MRVCTVASARLRNGAIRRTKIFSAVFCRCDDGDREVKEEGGGHSLRPEPQKHWTWGYRENIGIPRQRLIPTVDARRQVRQDKVLMPEKKMLILRGIAGHYAGRDWPRGALDEPPALEYARRKGYVGQVLDVAGATGPQSPQTKMALAEVSSRRDRYGPLWIFGRRLQRAAHNQSLGARRTRPLGTGGRSWCAEQSVPPV